MRRSLGTLSSATLGKATAKHNLFLSSSSALSTSAGGGGGRGRGRGGFDSSRFSPGTLGESQAPVEQDPSEDESHFPSGLGHGHGRGKSPPSAPVVPSFSPFTSDMNSTTVSRGRGRGYIPGLAAAGPPQHQEPQQQSVVPRKPIFFRKEDNSNSDSGKSPPATLNRTGVPQDNNLAPSFMPALHGAGRGKPPLNPSIANVDKKSNNEQVENRHLRSRQPTRESGRRKGLGSSTETSTSAPKMSPEEALQKAIEVLSKPGEGKEVRGRGTFRGRGRGRRPLGREPRSEDADNNYGGLYLGDDADGEKLAKRLGPDIMNKLVEGFNEMSSRVLPSPLDDAFVDAYHTNLLIECEPEYLMEEFGCNPDIDEKPPIPLREALEKMKPFLMAYEGIKSHQEWEEVVEETMARVPLLKEIVDYYSGPDRVTAKRQIEELERVANTLPQSSPASVKRFTERAVLSLKSNPGWGFDKKCQFMDKLVWEVSQQYK